MTRMNGKRAAIEISAGYPHLALAVRRFQEIGRKTLAVLKDEENELWLSPISLWEALTLHQKRRMQVAGDIGLWIKRALAGTKEAVLTHEIISTANELELHNDPSDRMIAATAS